MGNLRNWYESRWGVWETKYDTPLYTYQENSKTGARRAINKSGSGYSPMNRKWLEGADWDSDRPPLPRGGSAIRKPST